jgi:O-antigen/teichoic acid export membrane protein
VKRLLTDTSVFAGATAAVRLVTFLQVPVLARTFAPGDFARLDLANTLLWIAISLALLGQESALGIRLAAATGARSTAASGFWLVTGASVGLSAALSINAPSVARALFNSPTGEDVIRAMSVLVPVQALNLYAGAVLRCQGRTGAYAALALGGALAGLCGVLVLAVWLDRGAVGVFVGQVAGYGLALLAAVACTGPSIGGASWREAREMVRLGAPFCGVTLAYLTVGVLDRSFLVRLSSQFALAEYAAAAKAAQPLATVVGGFQMAWIARIASHRDGPVRAADVSATLRVYALAGAALLIVVSTFSHMIVSVVASPLYAGGGALVAILAVGHLLTGVQWLAGTGAALTQRTGVWTVAHLAGAALAGFVLFPALVPIHGNLGAALGTVGAQIVATAGIAVFSPRVKGLTIGMARVALAWVTCLAVVIVQVWVGIPVDRLGWLLRLALAAGGLGVTAWVFAGQRPRPSLPPWSAGTNAGAR